MESQKGIVLEEAHLVRSAGSYRPLMSEQECLDDFTVPKIIVLAALPPTLQPLLLSRLGISKVDRHITSTNRINVRCIISCALIHSQNYVDLVSGAIVFISSCLSPQGQILIFCRTKAWAMCFANRHG